MMLYARLPPRQRCMINSSTSKPKSLETFSVPDKYAVIEVGGVQKIVAEGRYYTCNRLQAEVGSRLLFGRVLAAKSNGHFHVGTPWMENVTVEAEILEEYKGDKIIVYKTRPKKHTRSKNGYRQTLTRFLVTSIKCAE